MSDRFSAADAGRSVVILACLIVLGILSSTLHGGSPWTSPVSRRTNDWQADLIQALSQRQRYQDALRICTDSAGKFPPQSDEAALWSVRQSEVLAAQQSSEEAFDADAIAVAQQPVQSLLNAYPDHRRALFLRAQLRQVELASVRSQVVAASVLPMAASADAKSGAPDTARSRLIESAASQIASLSIKLSQLTEEVAAQRARLDSRRGGVEASVLIDDLVHLRRSLLVRQVELALLETELFPQMSEDSVAAAARAERAAANAIESVPTDSAARQELERLRVIATLRSGRPDRASMLLQRLVSSLTTIPPEVTAAAVLVDLANEDLDGAERRIREFYSGAPLASPLSLEMDLAALRVRLANREPSDTVAAWIEMIERRHGAYGRRRAETLTLSRLGSQEDGRPMDASIVAAQGRERLRSGEPLRAAKLLSAAAAAESDPESAVRHAAESAAAFLSAEAPRNAADILTRITRKHPAAPAAPAAHLQAALLLAQVKPEGLAELLEEHLRSTIELWPQSESAAGARQWLVRLLDSQGRSLQAAEVLAGTPVDQMQPAALDAMLARWQSVLRDPSYGGDGGGQRFVAAVEHLFERPELRQKVLRTAALVLDRATLAKLPVRQQAEAGDGGAGVGPQDERFLLAFDRFRRQGVVSPALQNPPQQIAEQARWRLMRDAEEEAMLRDDVARILISWPAESETLLQKAQRQLWIGRVDRAVQSYREAIQVSNDPGVTLRDAAETLGKSDSADAKQGAIRMWEEFAAGVGKGSDAWHEAKLKACRLYQDIGEPQEAARRAAYVLLTSPPESDELRSRYLAFKEAR